MFLLITEIVLAIIILSNMIKLFKYSKYLKDETLPASLKLDIRSDIERRIPIVFILMIVQLVVVALN